LSFELESKIENPKSKIGKAMAKKNLEKKRFEEALEELEKVVERLESGQLSLEESLAAFEEGVRLVKYCNQKLTEVEKKIELLVKDKEGKLQLKPLEDVGDEESEEES
jgi:exodeoxyribonuclease VII small subunit